MRMNEPLVWEKTSATPVARDWLTFRLGGSECAVDLSRVFEIIPFTAPAREAFDAGRRYPVIDLRTKQSCPAVYNSDTTAILTEVVGHRVAVIVDSVADVLEFALDGSAAANDGVLGIVQINTGHKLRVLRVMDFERLLGADALAASYAARG
jgi:chemotaxis signal transduction protein